MTEDTTWTEPGVVTKASPRSVADTVSRLTGLVTAKGMKVFGVIDQAAAAREVGLELRETTLVMFGSPAAGWSATTGDGGASRPQWNAVVGSAAGPSARRGLRMVKAARAPARRQSAPEMNDAVRKPAENSSGWR